MSNDHNGAVHSINMKAWQLVLLTFCAIVSKMVSLFQAACDLLSSRPHCHIVHHRNTFKINFWCILLSTNTKLLSKSNNVFSHSAVQIFFFLHNVVFAVFIVIHFMCKINV